MTKLSRREFLRLLAAGAGAATLEGFLTACSKRVSTPASIIESLSTATMPPQATAPGRSPADADAAMEPTLAADGGATPAPAALPQGAPDLVVARGGEPEDLVRRALAAFGGIEKFVPRDASVIVKPNICVAYHSYEYAATTNPWVVGALVKLCLEAGARSVQVLDYPFGGSAEEAYVVSGIQEQVEAAGGKMVGMPGFKYVETDLPDALDLKRTKVFGDVLKADVLIDVPIAKNHGLARLTLGMKNLMGLVQNRGAIHANLGQRVADLASLFRPTLTVIDAVRILLDNGPSGGDLADVKKLDTLIVSPDIVAADSYATSLFGMQPEDIAYIRAAAAMGLGRSDTRNLKIEELAL